MRLLAFLLCTSTLLASTPEQDFTLYLLREAYVRAQTDAERDSIKQEVRALVSSYKVDAGRAQEQLNLWDVCCATWSVESVDSSQKTGGVRLEDLRAEVAEAFRSQPVTEANDFTETPKFVSSTGDTVFYSSNRAPGYGGMDVVYSAYHYNPQPWPHSKWLPAEHRYRCEHRC